MASTTKTEQIIIKCLNELACSLTLSSILRCSSFISLIISTRVRGDDAFTSRLLLRAAGRIDAVARVASVVADGVVDGNDGDFAGKRVVMAAVVVEPTVIMSAGVVPGVCRPLAVDISLDDDQGVVDFMWSLEMFSARGDEELCGELGELMAKSGVDLVPAVLMDVGNAVVANCC